MREFFPVEWYMHWIINDNCELTTQRMRKRLFCVRGSRLCNMLKWEDMMSSYDIFHVSIHLFQKQPADYALLCRFHPFMMHLMCSTMSYSYSNCIFPLIPFYLGLCVVTLVWGSGACGSGRYYLWCFP